MLITMLISMLTLIFNIRPVAAVPITRMSVIPCENSWIEPAKTIGSTFSVDLNVYNATGLSAWQVGITWDAKVLDFVSYTWGNFRLYAGFTLRIDPTIDKALGKWATPASETWAIGGVEGGVTTHEVTMLTLTFKFTAYGASLLTMIDAIVVDWENTMHTPPAFTLEQGTAELLPVPTVPGDINGDFRCNYKDLYILAVAYGSDPIKPNWNPNADINVDDKVDYKDLYILVTNYGKTYS